MKIWITKYALTVGILVRESKQDPDGSSVVVLDQLAPNGWVMFFGKDWHTSESAAIECASQMREDKIASLKKQIQKLDKLSFR